MAVRDDEQCPQRGPGLNHTSGGGICTTCGQICVARASAVGVIAAPAPAAHAAPVDDRSCSCYECRHPSGEAANIATRVRHRAAHEGFVDWLGDHPAIPVVLARRPSPREILAMRFNELHAEPLGRDACEGGR